MSAPGTQRWRASLLLSLASLLAALGVAEVALRVLRPAPASRVVYPCFYREDARLGFRYQPGATDRIAAHFEIDNTVTLNSLGFHDDEPLPATSLRVLAVGDSFTAALNLKREEVWTAVLERELRAAGRSDADVVNVGLDGTGTDVHGDLLRAYAPRFDPQVIVLAFYANDVLDVLNGRFRRECHRGYVLSFQDDRQREVLRERVDAHLSRGGMRWLFDHSYLVRLATHLVAGPQNLFRLEFVQPSARELGVDERVRRARRPRLREAFADLERIAGECRCRLLVVPVPPRRSLDGSLKVLRKHVPDLALEVVDVVPAMQHRLREDGRRAADLYWIHDNHLNAYGNRLFAEALAPAILERLPAHP